jgi:UDP-N-acetyl-D-galactosamine dehydrogenase
MEGGFEMKGLLEELKRGKEKICIVGLGYVGLPLAVSLAEHFKVVGFDKNSKRVKN